jgi:hypothetical protein
MSGDAASRCGRRRHTTNACLDCYPAACCASLAPFHSWLVPTALLLLFAPLLLPIAAPFLSFLFLSKFHRRVLDCFAYLSHWHA